MSYKKIVSVYKLKELINNLKLNYQLLFGKPREWQKWSLDKLSIFSEKLSIVC